MTEKHMKIFHKVFFRYFRAKKHLKSIVVVAILLFVINGLTLVSPAILARVMDQITLSDYSDTYFYIASFILLSTILAIITPIQTKHATKWLSQLQYEYHLQWIKEIMQKPFSLFAKKELGALTQAIDRGFYAYAGMTYALIVMILPGVVRMFVTFVYLLHFSGLWLTLSLAICTAMLFLSMRWGLKRRSPYIRETNEAEDTFSTHLVDVFQATRMIKLSHGQAMAKRLLERTHHNLVRKKIRLATASSALTSLEDFVIVAGSALVLFLSLTLAPKDHSSGDFLALFLYSFFFIESMAIVTDGLQEFERDHQNSKELDTILATPNTIDSLKGQPANIHNIHTRQDLKITIKPFSVALSEDKATVLQNPHEMTIRSGKTVISGASGEGKTSLCEMLARVSFHQDLANTIHISNTPISHICENTLRDILYFSENQPSFLSGNLIQSLGLPKNIEPSSRQLQELLEILELDRFSNLANKETTFPKESLSSGEKKRFSLARAMLLNRPITILDEPTSALNEKMAASIWKTIFAHFHNHLLICITHDGITPEFDQYIHIQNHTLQMIDKA